MMRHPAVASVLVLSLLLVGCSADMQSQASAAEPPAEPQQEVQFSSVEELESAAVKRDVPYVPTRQETVDEMLRMAKVTKNDLVYDLGSGDGRIVITAAREYGARGVGIDIDPQRIREANENARNANVTGKVKFIEGDLFQADLREATAVTLYLLSSVNLRLRPKLLEELRPGTPVVSHDFSMGDWEPEEQKSVGSDDLFLWIIPAKVQGNWRWTAPGGGVRTAQLNQTFQKLSGSVRSGNDSLQIRDGKLRGEEITFEAVGADGVVEKYTGRVSGKTIRGTVERNGQRSEWSARND
jgi:SAM-dependent methyltransferase